MSDTKSRKFLWGVLLATAASYTLHSFVFSDGALNTVVDRAPNTSQTSEPLLANKDSQAALTIKQQQVVRSTPREHDQLVISPILEGTNIDGSLRADANGNLILDIQVRDFFDYFLSIADDVGAEQAIGEIQRYALSYLPEPASTQAIELLGNYLRYKQTEYIIQQTPISAASLEDSDALQLLRSSFDQLRVSRQSLFSVEQGNALFGLEDSYANHTLSSLELMADERTSDEYKRQQLAVLESRLPPELSSSFSRTRIDRQRQRSIEEITNSTQDDVQVYEQLKQHDIEPQQLDSIIQRRQQQRDFNSVYRRYQIARQGLDTTSAHHSAEIIELQNRFFANPEDRTQAKLRDLKQD